MLSLLSALTHRARHAVARMVLWIIQPELGPMLNEIDSLASQIIQRKVDHAHVAMDSEGVLRASQPTAFQPYERPTP